MHHRMPMTRRGMPPSYVGATRDDVVAVQTRVSDRLVALGVVVAGCPTLPLNLTQAWDNLAARMLGYASGDPGVMTVDAGNALLTESNVFGNALTAAGCSNTPPPAPIPQKPAQPGSLFDIPGLSQLGGMAGGLLLLGLLYVMSKGSR